MKEIYKCSKCGNVVELDVNGGGQLNCCGVPMDKLSAKTADSSTEKHVPYIEETENGYLVKVGETTAHPMTEEHYIVFIELEVDGKIYKKYLTPSDKPEASFNVEKGSSVSAREYCNLHGLWANK